MLPERRVQLPFSFSEAFQLLVFALTFWAAWRTLTYLPNREGLGPVTSELRITPVQLDAARFGPLSLAGAWELQSDDPRFGGFSALAIDQGSLLALTDNGTLASFAKPSPTMRPLVTMRELPDGPGNKDFIWNRDAEAIARDPLGRGWWVSFELRHELWLYDANFSRGLKRVHLGVERWSPNGGVEALVARPGPELLMFVEHSGRLFRMRGSKAVAETVQGLRASVSEAAPLPDGRVAVIERSFSPGGFRNALAILAPIGDGLHVAERFKLPAGMLANLEGLAAEPRPGGSTRLWIISDDNFQRPLRTLLLAVDLPPKRQSP